ncbi:hypothetical protein HMI54_007902 [Coelomomyces lativittatus]|nr:hypothetical protein HMI55_002483 [Coelomomyces lativittatus]KAJ1503623.1 hypothetical protein HMI54_007902 [Coelomomyces lativittatus]KAJ1504088.1 hypothetical protein HMI56_001800 [Coelomomyces lativittatus]
MSLYVPPRGGTRGGRDQFKWSDVKADKHRENYLGHSVMAPVGRWQQGRDLQWYSKENSTRKVQASISEEFSAVKKAEEDAMMVALGLKRPIRGVGDADKNKEEIARLMANMEKEDFESGMTEEREAELSIKGLGSKRTSKLLATSMKEHDIIPGTLMNPSNPTSQSLEIKPLDQKEKKSHRLHSNSDKKKERKKHYGDSTKENMKTKKILHRNGTTTFVPTPNHHSSLEHYEHRHSHTRKRDRSRSYDRSKRPCSPRRRR